MKYNAFEKRVGGFLSSYPKAKSFLKYTYKRFNYIVYILLLRRSQLSTQTPALITDKKKNYFFGYYGKYQINQHGTILLCSTEINGRMPRPTDKLRLLYGKMSDYKYHEFSTTSSWNWQQGCMLQWLSNYPGEVAIYNDYREGNFVSIIHDVNKGILNTYDIPIYAISKNNEFALSLNFSRLYHLSPGYGYCTDINYKLRDMASGDDGIWFLDFQTGENRLILSLEQLCKFMAKESMKSAYHKVNHIEISPHGKRFMFLHRWINSGKKYSRLLTANIDGSDVFLLSDFDMVSHCAWKNDYQILAWARRPTLGDRYYLFEDKSSKFSTMGDNVLTEDGHPSFSPDMKMIVTDTYPDKLRMRSLILYDIEKNKRIVLGRYFAPLRYDGDMRCDLHPRWSIGGKYISFDSCHENMRKSYVIDFEMVDDK